MSTKLTYGEQLRHPLWQRRRLERLEKAGFRCEDCQDTETTLHVHHLGYIRGRQAWEYNDSQLRVLCANCHADATETGDLLQEILSYASADIVALLGGFDEHLDVCHGVDIQAAQRQEPLLFEIGRIASTLMMLGVDDIQKVAEIVDDLARDGTLEIVRGKHGQNPHH